MPREKTDHLVVHCSATPPSMNVGVREIDRWHRARGWLQIGYHFVIRRNGKIEPGRAINAIGAHAKGFNHNTIGICLVGGVDDDGNPEANYTDNQWGGLTALLDVLTEQYPDATICGHNELNPKKSCPSFDVRRWVLAEYK